MLVVKGDPSVWVLTRRKSILLQRRDGQGSGASSPWKGGRPEGGRGPFVFSPWLKASC